MVDPGDGKSGVVFLSAQPGQVFEMVSHPSSGDGQGNRDGAGQGGGEQGLEESVVQGVPCRAQVDGQAEAGDWMVGLSESGVEHRGVPGALGVELARIATVCKIGRWIGQDRPGVERFQGGAHGGIIQEYRQVLPRLDKLPQDQPGCVRIIGGQAEPLSRQIPPLQATDRRGLRLSQTRPAREQQRIQKALQQRPSGEGGRGDGLRHGSGDQGLNLLPAYYGLPLDGKFVLVFLS